MKYLIQLNDKTPICLYFVLIFLCYCTTPKRRLKYDFLFLFVQFCALHLKSRKLSSNVIVVTSGVVPVYRGITLDLLI